MVFNGNGRNDLITGPTRLRRGSWSHVVMVRQAQKITVYLNGDPKPEITANLPIAWPADCEDILLGGRADNFANLQGMLEDVALYDRALTPQEVKTHFDSAGAKQVEGPSFEAPAKPTPENADQSLRKIHVRDGFEVQRVAAER